MGDNKPLVSYVLTAYNIENFIEESVKCAFSQTYSPLQIVISDDCSTDRTFEIIQKLASEYTGPHKIVLNRNQVNMGISQHMSKAYIDLADGEIIIAAHGDDISVPERTEKSVEFLLSHPQVNAISGGLVVIDSDGNVLEEQSKNTVVKETHYYDYSNAKKGMSNIPAPSRAFYKSVMTEFGYLSKDCPTEDELICFRAQIMGGVNAFLPDVFVKYRKHAGGFSNPEKFIQFPLEEIRFQQIRDMEVAVERGWITSEKKKAIEKQTYRAMMGRKAFRRYFAYRNFKNLMGLVFCRYVGFKRKIRYLLNHKKFKKTGGN